MAFSPEAKAFVPSASAFLPFLTSGELSNLLFSPSNSSRFSLSVCWFFAKAALASSSFEIKSFSTSSASFSSSVKAKALIWFSRSSSSCSLPPISSVVVPISAIFLLISSCITLDIVSSWYGFNVVLASSSYFNHRFLDFVI
ncbi:hypothetical protein FHPHGOJG_02901 [Mannheimia haemolytica]